MQSASSLPVSDTGTRWNQAFRGLVAALTLLGSWLSACPTLAADGLNSSWSAAGRSAVRLVAAGGFEDGSYQAGIEIKLDPGTLTYWRTPGDAGVPPVFGFDGSVNLAKADVRYPAPARYSDGGTETFGYKNDVIFPLDVTPKDARLPIEIVLDLHYATCDQICLPAEAKLNLTLGPQQRPGPEAERIAAARAKVPRTVTATGNPGFSVVPLAAAAAPTWAVRFSPNPGATADLFAEAPDGYYFDTKRADGFELVLAQKPPAATGRVLVTLTLVDGPAAYQSTISLDVTPVRP